MRTRILVIGALAIAAGFANAQTPNVQTRRAAMVGGGNPNSGKCTVDVIVDGSAQVEVRGDNATLRNTGGQAPQWRRFECTGPMPANPANFRFVGVDGRGRQTLARDPRNNGGAAVVQIEDSDAGSEGYTFDLFWGGEPPITGGFQGDRGPVQSNDRPFDNGGRNDQGFRPPNDRPNDRPDDRPNDRSGDRGDFRRDRRMPEDQAFDICRRSIRDQAAARFRVQNIDIRNISMDNNPGRRDWIMGDVAVPRRFGRFDIYHFSCSVNFDTGVVRNTHIDQFEQGYYSNRR